MNPNHGREEEIFEAARDLASPEARAEYLSRACGEDAALRERVQGMLRDDSAAAEFFGTTRPNPASAAGLADTIRINPSPEEIGAVIGRYKLREKIGEGGCGVVYVAEQEQPVRRRVALKIIKLGMDTKSVVARFEAERQALAMMDHPNIAKVIDAGTTDTGRPYFVMELVRGVKVTEYCDKHGLTVSARLDLFIKICRAVQHAHQKGIIHRDLKPSNILVTLHDGVPVPKIIDFGIAKATEGRLTDLTIYTQLNQFIGTPAYMSPEQAEMSGLDIDTRSDIYALGVLLYELLTSRTPFDAKELIRAGLDELRRKIREDEPVRPSTRLSTMLDADLTTVAKHAAADPPKLISLLRGDLDWIVMKALEKDRTRRYDTANGMAMDIERFQQNEPVLACPPSQFYRLRKFARRNRVGFAAVAAVSAALLLGLVVSAWQAVRATRAQRNERSARLAADESRARESQERRLAQDNARKAAESERTTQRLLYAADMKLAHAAWEEGNLSRMTSLLEAHRPKPGDPDTRGFEYFYFQELAKGEQAQILPGHTNAVLGVAVSPDGKWFASRGETDTRLWDLSSRTVVAAWPSRLKSNTWVRCCGPSFSYDSRYLAFPSEEGLELCDVPTHQTRLLLSGDVERPLFSPVTNLIAFDSGGSEGRIHVWDYAANKEAGVTGPDSGIWCWSPEGSRLLGGPSSATTGHLDWWDASTFNRVETDQAAQFIFGAALSRNGRLTAAADWQGEVWLLESPGGKVLGTMDCGDTWPAALTFSPDGRFLATSSSDQAILVWDLASRQRVRQLRGHKAKVTSLAYAPDGQLLISGDADGKVLVWDMGGQTRRPQIVNRLRSVGAFNDPKFSPDGKLLAVRIDHNDCAILDASSLQPQSQSQSSIGGDFVAFSPDSRQMAFIPAGGSKPVLQLTGLSAHSPRATIPLGIDEISPDGRFLAAGGNALFEAATGTRILWVPYGKWHGSFSPDGHSWLKAADTAVEVWDLQSRHKTKTLDCGNPLTTSAAISPDSRFVAASCEDLRILLWDLNSNGPPVSLTGHQAQVRALCFSSDGRTLASGGEDRRLKLWDLAARREIASFIQEKAVYWLAFSPDNQTLVWGDIGSYHVWRAPREQPLAPGSSSQPAAADLPADSVWRVPDGEAPPSPQMLAEKDLCRTNLLKIHAAIMSYQKDHGQMPDWLSDLVPKYLPDTNCLLCPVWVAAEALPIWLSVNDPKVTTSYSYEFCARSNIDNDVFGLAAPGDTMKAWKTKQLARYGGIVPVLRCWEHGETLNVSYDGNVFESSQGWERAVDVKWRARNPAGAEQWYRKMEQEGDVDALNNLAWHFATSWNSEERDGGAAVRLAEKAVELTNRKDPGYMDTLAAAYAETGQFDKAVSAEIEAISLLKSSPSTASMEAMIEDYQGRLDLFRQQRPLRR
jgi:eukaryotic-like serine/threonine-protein kinase